MIDAQFVIMLIINSLLCKSGFDLFEGKCIKYAFYAIYHVDYYSELVQLFNPNKSNLIYTMKIGNNITYPNYKHNFDKVEENQVYYYILEEVPISLSYLFADTTKLIYFNFENTYTNLYYITDIEGMFLGCISLRSITFNSFEGKNVINMSHLFSGYTSLQNIDFSNFKPDNLQKMNNLFYGCLILKSIDLSHISTSKVTNISSIFYNCKSLIKVEAEFDTRNVVDISQMFFNCVLIKSIRTSNYITKNIINM